MFFALSKIAWVIVTPSNLLLCFLFLSALLAGIRRSRRAYGIHLFALSLFLVCGYLPIGTAFQLMLEERFALFVDDGRPIAGIIVLGGWTDTEIAVSRDVVAVNDATERFFAAQALTRRHPEARLVFSGGDGSFSGDVGDEADDVMRLARSLGFDDRAVIFERRSRNTYENAVFTKALVMPKPDERWLMVTSAGHMPRSVGCFRAIGFDVIPVPVDFRTRGRSDLLRPARSLAEGLLRLDLAFREWAGLLAYWLSGRSGALFPAP